MCRSCGIHTILNSGLYKWCINIQHNDTQHIGDTFILCNSFYYSAECHCAECGSNQCFLMITLSKTTPYSMVHYYTKFHCTEYCYAECYSENVPVRQVSFLLGVIMSMVIIKIVILPSVILPSVILLRLVLL